VTARVASTPSFGRVAICSQRGSEIRVRRVTIRAASSDGSSVAVTRSTAGWRGDLFGVSLLQAWALTFQCADVGNLPRLRDPPVTSMRDHRLVHPNPLSASVHTGEPVSARDPSPPRGAQRHAMDIDAALTGDAWWVVFGGGGESRRCRDVCPLVPAVATHVAAMRLTLPPPCGRPVA
jgi:hypothetical protein